MRTVIFGACVVAFCCLPVWAFDYFVNQDGSAHLQSAFMMNEILFGRGSVSPDLTLNTLTVPNSTGHWLMSFLLNIFPPFIVTKIIVTLTFLLPVAAIVWLRVRTVGREDLTTTLLVAASISFNWLWLVGFYNFLIGFAVCGFTAGFAAKWSDGLNLRRALALASMFLLAYFSHIVALAVLAGSVGFFLVVSSQKLIRRDLPLYVAALLPVIPLALIYRTVNAGPGGGFFPVWRHLANPFSPVSWFAQIRAADPFIIISRKSLPFTEFSSTAFAAFTPGMWIALAIIILIAATVLSGFRDELRSRITLAFTLLFAGTVAAALFAPDDFGLSNGSVLRERLLLCGVLFLIPVFRVSQKPKMRVAANVILAAVVAFQTVALWDYAATSSREAREYLTVSSAIPAGASVASISRIENGSKFHAAAVPMMTNYLGFNPTRVVRDNYEIGHKLFPVRAATDEFQRFVFDFTRNSAIVLDNSSENPAAKVNELAAVLAVHHEKIDYMILWNRNEEVTSLIAPYFDAEPIFTNARVSVHRHR